MTHSRRCSSGHIRNLLQTPADAQREKIPLSINSAHATSAASSGVEPLSALLELAHEVLGIRCGSSDNFFDHGDSIAAAQLCALGNSRYGWTITPRDVFGWQSFALLAGVIERDETERSAAVARPGQERT